MKKLFILLGLVETATEEQVIKAVTSLKKDNESKATQLAEIAKKIADKDAKIGVLESAINDANIQLGELQSQLNDANKTIETVKQDVEANFETAVAEKTKELQEQVAELEFKLTDAPAADTKSDKELKAIASETMQANELTHVYMVTDGTPFYREEDAINHARKVGGKHYLYGEKAQDQE